MKRDLSNAEARGPSRSSCRLSAPVAMGLGDVLLEEDEWENGGEGEVGGAWS